MPSPFPGMDPFLERPDIFPDFRDRFVTYLSESLQAVLPAPYFAAIGRRVWIEASRRSVGPVVPILVGPRRSSVPGDVEGSQGWVAVAAPIAVRVVHDEFREPLIEIYAGGGRDKRLVTSIELLSLANKTPGAHGRDLYIRKQREVLESAVHLVEIDLLRGGAHATAVPLDAAREACGPFDYHASVHRFDDPDTFYVCPIRLEDRLPSLTVPLLPGDPSVMIDLQPVVDRLYDAGPYAREIDYERDAIDPPLGPERAAWVADRLGA